MIQLSEEGMSKAKINQKLGLQYQRVSRIVNAKETFLKEIKSAAPVNTQKIRKQKRRKCWWSGEKIEADKAFPYARA